MAMTTSVRAWGIALVLSMLLHLTGTIGFIALDPGEKEPAAGQLTASTVDSLQQILGSPEVASEPTPDVIEAETAIEAEPVNTSSEVAPPPVEVADEVQQESVEAVAAANAASDTPITSLQDAKAEPIEALQPTQQSKVEPGQITEAAPSEIKQQPEKPKKKTVKQPTNKGYSQRNAAGQLKSGAGGTRTANRGAIRRYGVRVRTRIARNKPRSVGRGLVRVSLGISKSGGLRFVRIVKSSGNARIDRAAISAVRRSAPFPRPPTGASSSQLQFAISFTFR